MSLIRRFAANVLASYLGTLVAIVVSFFYTPFLVRYLGTSRYGLWALTLSVAQTTILFDLGLTHAVRRFQTQAAARNDRQEINDILGLSLRVYLPVGLAALAACLSAIYWLPRVASIPAGLLGELAVVMAAMGVFVMFGFWRSGFVGLIFGANRIDLQNIVSLSQKLLTAGLGAALLIGWRRDLVSPSVAVVAAAAFCLLLAGALARHVLPTMRLGLGPARSPLLRPMLTFGAHAMVQQVAYVVLLQAPTLIVGALIDVDAVAKLAIPLLITTQFGLLVGPLAVPMFPLAAQLDVRADAARLSELYVRGSRLCLLLCLSAAVPLVIFGEDFIRLWVGPSFAWTWGVLAILLVGEVIRLSQNPAWHLLMATRSIRGLSITQPLRAALLVALLIGSIKWTGFGLLGVAGAVTLLAIPFEGVFLAAYTCRQLRLSVARYLVRTYLKPSLVAAAVAAACLAVRFHWRPARLMHSVGELFAAGCVSLALGLLIATDAQDRRRLFSLFPWRRAVAAHSPDAQIVEE